MQQRRWAGVDWGQRDYKVNTQSLRDVYRDTGVKAGPSSILQLYDRDMRGATTVQASDVQGGKMTSTGQKIYRGSNNLKLTRTTRGNHSCLGI